MFAFNINYSQFPRADIDYRKIWTFYTNGYRIETFRNSEKIMSLIGKKFI